jgi:hypothetical protein
MISRFSRCFSIAADTSSAAAPGNTAAAPWTGRGLRDVRFQQLLIGHQLGVGQQHRELRARQSQAAALAFGDFRVGRQVFDLPVQQALRLQHLDEVLLGAQARHAHALHQLIAWFWR